MSPFDRLLRQMTRPWVATLYIGLIILAFFYLDKPIANYFHEINLKLHFPLLTWLTRLGLGLLYIIPFFILGIYFHYIRPDRKKEAYSWFLLLCVIVPGTICGVLKVLLSRARPDMWFNSQLYGFYGLQTHAGFWSFPSGHTTTIMGAVFGLSIVFPRYYKPFLLTGIIIAISRVLLTRHYLSDIMVAAYLTLLETGLLLYVLRRKSWLMPAWDNK